MTTFDKREEGFEKKFALDEEQKFKAEARRNRLLGLWVAEKLGMSADAASAYAKDVIAAEFETAGDANVVRKVTVSYTHLEFLHIVGGKVLAQRDDAEGLRHHRDRHEGIRRERQIRIDRVGRRTGAGLSLIHI